MNFWHFIRVVRARKWVILGVVAVTLLVVLIAAPSPRRAYEATAFMSPTPQVMQNGVNPSSGTDQPNPAQREVVLSNLIILAQGGDVYQEAMDFLALPTEEQRRLAPGLPDYRQINRIEATPGTLMSFREWGDVLEVAPVTNSRIGESGTTTDIIRITVKLPDDTLPPYIANAVGYAFVQAFQEKSREDIRSYERFLATEMREAKNTLNSLQKQIEDHKRSHKVVAVDSETQTAISSLANLESEVSQAQAEVRQAEALLANLNSQLASQPTVIHQKLPADMSPAIVELKKELAVAEAELREMQRRYTPSHEAYRASQARVTQLRQRIAAEGANYGQSQINPIRQELLKRRSDTSSNLDRARARLASVSASTSEARARIEDLSRLEPELAMLLRDEALAEKRYNNLSEKHSQALIAEQETTRTGSIVPFGWARIATGPIVQGPTKWSLLAYGLLLSLLAGVLMAVWLDSVDNRLRSAADAERFLELPAIGLTPELTGQDGALPRLTHLYPLSPMAESYRILRTKVLLVMRNQPFRTMMVAAGRPQQGATTTICNLAIALAQSGMRVILIDADMRHPCLHSFFSVPNISGLSTLLQGSTALADAFQKTEIENLVVVPAGPQPPNPSELLGSGRMREVVGMLEEHCDLVLFDTPSAAVFSDALTLANMVDAAVMVVAANQVPRRSELEVRDLIREAGANVVGVVVNRMSPDNIDSCFFYSRYYQELPPALPGGDAIPSTASRRSRNQRSRPADRIEPSVLMRDTTRSASKAETATKSISHDDDEPTPFPE